MLKERGWLELACFYDVDAALAKCLAEHAQVCPEWGRDVAGVKLLAQLAMLTWRWRSDVNSPDKRPLMDGANLPSKRLAQQVCSPLGLLGLAARRFASVS